MSACAQAGVQGSGAGLESGVRPMPGSQSQSRSHQDGQTQAPYAPGRLDDPSFKPRTSVSSLRTSGTGNHTRASSVTSNEYPSPSHSSVSKLRSSQQDDRFSQRRPSLPFPLLALHNYRAKRRRESHKSTAEEEDSQGSSPNSSRRGSVAAGGIQMHPLTVSGTRDTVAEGSNHGRRGRTQPKNDRDAQRDQEAVERWRKWALEQTNTTPAFESVHAPRRTSAPAAPLRYQALSSSNRSTLDPALSPYSNGVYGDTSPQASGSSSPYSDPSSSMDISGLPLDGDEETPTGVSLRFSSFDDVAVDITKLNQSRPPVRPRISTLPNPLVPLQKMLGAKRTRPLMLELIHAVGLYVDAVWVVYRNGQRPPGSVPSSDPEKPTWVSPTLKAIAQAKEQSILPEPTETDITFYGREVQEAVAEVEEALGGGKWSFARYLIVGGYGSVTIRNAGGEADVDWSVEVGGGPGMIRLLSDMEDVLWGDAPPRPLDLQFELPDDFEAAAAQPYQPTTETITALCDFLAEAPRQGLHSEATVAAVSNTEIPSLQIPELPSVDALGQVKSSHEERVDSDALLEAGRQRYRAWAAANATGTVGA